MRRLLCTLLACAALSACGAAATPDQPAADADAAAPAIPTALPGARSVDRARRAVSATEERALRHDTIR